MTATMPVPPLAGHDHVTVRGPPSPCEPRVVHEWCTRDGTEEAGVGQAGREARGMLPAWEQCGATDDNPPDDDSPAHKHAIGNDGDSIPSLVSQHFPFFEDDAMSDLPHPLTALRIVPLPRCFICGSPTIFTCARCADGPSYCSPQHFLAVCVLHLLRVSWG